MSSRRKASTPRIAFCRVAVVLLSFLCLSACDKKEGINVSGTVTFEGTPVPAGILVFVPNRRQGNEGINAMADIEEGQIKLKERLVAPGPCRVQISAYDGVPLQVGEHTERLGTMLVPIQMVEVELPENNAELNISMKKVSEMAAEIDVEVN